MEDAYDAVVVGSGFGGGIAACRLAEAGWRVCVLERGRRFGPGDFPDRPEQAPFAFWHHFLNPGGMFDLRLMKDLSVLTAAGWEAARWSTPTCSFAHRPTCSSRRTGRRRSTA